MDSLASVRRISSLHWGAYPCLPGKALRVRATAIQPHAALIDGHQMATVQWLNDAWVSVWILEQVSLALGHPNTRKL